MRNKFLAAAFAALATLALPAQSATVISNVSGVYSESGKARSNAPAKATQLRDFDETDGNPLLEIVGDTHIFGFVAHRANFSGSLFTDKWAMDFGTDVYDVVFTWDAFDRPGKTVEFDGRFGVNGLYTLLGTNGVLNLGPLTGVVEFDLDPIFGAFLTSNDERAVWDLSATRISVMPVPAGGVLLLTGFAGLVVLRRGRKTA